MSAASDAEEAFFTAWTAQWTTLSRDSSEGELWALGEREHKFHPERRWRLDFAWPCIQLAVEIEGRGRHQTVVGFRKDCEKYNTALALGWRVLRFPATDYKPSKSRAEWPNGAADWAQIVLEVMCHAL